MELGPLEAQVLISASLVTPVIAVLVVAALKGHLSRSEDAKYAVLWSRERDYWNEAEQHDEEERGDEDGDQASS